LANNGALSIELRIILVSSRQRRLNRLCQGSMGRCREKLWSTIANVFSTGVADMSQLRFAALVLRSEVSHGGARHATGGGGASN
jgi:hypothetical protein